MGNVKDNIPSATPRGQLRPDSIREEVSDNVVQPGSLQAVTGSSPEFRIATSLRDLWKDERRHGWVIILFFEYKGLKQRMMVWRIEWRRA